MSMKPIALAYISAAVVGTAMGIAGGTTAHAKTYTDVRYQCQSSSKAPWMHFKKGSAPYGTLYVYYSTVSYACGGSSLGPERRKITMKAGSGLGNANSCVRNEGWLPNGTYDPVRYERNHQTSSTVVKGSVWYLPDHKCSNGTWRTELFIHSQGGNGGSWSSSNYKSNGCIKIDQDDRSYLAGLYNIPVYGASRTTLDVD